MGKFPFFRQLDQMDCGPTCLKMISKFYGKNFSIEFLRNKSFITKEGVNLLGLSNAAEAINIRTLSVNVDFETLKDNVPLPCIVNWRQRHFVVVYKIKKNTVYVADPAIGLIKYNKDEFLNGWLYNKKREEENIVMLFEPTIEFYNTPDDESKSKEGFRFLLHYVLAHKESLYQLLYGLIATTAIQLVFPFTTQAIVDYGINNQNLNFIYLILLGQLMLFFSQSFIGIIRSWILLHMGARINISIISDFLAKLMKLPISFFDSKMTTDLMQRIEDNRRVENFLSSTSLNVLFSMFTLVVFGGILGYYSLEIFLIFFTSAILYIGWVLLFSRKRAILDYKRYDEAAENRSSILQLITGIAEIKLNNSETKRRWEWEAIQIRLFKISTKGLAITQLQINGAGFINELKNIIIIIVAARSVISGSMTLGTMLAIQYILGQLNAPIADFITFFQGAQDAKLSIQRLSEIHGRNNEEETMEDGDIAHPVEKGNITLNNISFQYGGPKSKWVLKDIDLTIPEGKVTAVVGTSGSGKTTLLKLLLKFYAPQKGSISVGDADLKQISTPAWRSRCGVVMQDGFIFADTIARNISESSSENRIDKSKLKMAVDISNLEQLIESLPNGYSTNLSWGGLTLSGGERQRMLIARAIYKDPRFLFFDEATSSLDANNEKEIMEKLSEFYSGRTVIIIAHRLSTVRNADQIVVLHRGEIVELGNHEKLIEQKGHYYTLVKNQLELGD